MNLFTFLRPLFTRMHSSEPGKGSSGALKYIISILSGILAASIFVWLAFYFTPEQTRHVLRTAIRLPSDRQQQPVVISDVDSERTRGGAISFYIGAKDYSGTRITDLEYARTAVNKQINTTSKDFSRLANELQSLNKRLEGLQFRPEDVKLAGIMRTKGPKKAVLETKTGELFLVKEGDEISKGWKIAKISDEEIRISNKRKDGKEITVTLQM